MFNQITWAGYFTALLILLFIYYTCIVVLYFKNELVEIISGKKKVYPVKSESGFTAVKNNLETPQNKLLNIGPVISYPPSYDTIDKFPSVHELTNELQQAIQKAGTQVYKKEELTFSLQLVLKKYPQLKNTNFAEAINKLIATECQNYCSIPLNEDEVNMLWV